VERGEKAPTVVVLDRIAAGLEVALASLVAEPDAERVIVRRAADQDRVDEPDGWQRTILSPVVPGVNFEWIRSTLPPGCDAGTFPAYAAGSREFSVAHYHAISLTSTHHLATGRRHPVTPHVRPPPAACDPGSVNVRRVAAARRRGSACNATPA
jgi:hypothetical protein